MIFIEEVEGNGCKKENVLTGCGWFGWRCSGRHVVLAFAMEAGG
jgi:hypothetical protein